LGRRPEEVRKTTMAIRIVLGVVGGLPCMHLRRREEEGRMEEEEEEEGGGGMKG